MLLRPATRNCGRNIGPLFRIAASKFQDAKFRALPHSGSGNVAGEIASVAATIYYLDYKTLFSISVCSGNGDTPVKFTRGPRSIRADWLSRQTPDLSGKLGACAPIDHELGPGDC